ncbi:MAG TPA: tetratricopeptide repeat protein [Bryobacteraceae bacterium]|nr:tetratricopeptide repeat protein [Bryobacteraceae bacterium]
MIACAFGFQDDRPAAVAASVPASQAAGEAAPKPEALTPERRADIYMARKMYREAIEQYRLMPETPLILNKIGIGYHQMLDLKTAKRYYERSIKANPKYSEAVNNLGTIYYAQKNYGRAVRQYRKALRLAPKSASIYSNLGTALFARKKYKDAFEAYQAALDLDPEVFEHRGSSGVLLQERSVEERSRFHFYLAKVYAKAGMTERALSYIRKALEEGFKERSKFFEDPEFASLQEVPEFKELMKQEPRVL